MLENVHTLMLRAKISGRGLGEALGIPRGQIARRLAGETSFYYLEMRAISQFFDVTFEELEGDLPDYHTWRARRDSNPKPSDPVVSFATVVNGGLTPFRLYRDDLELAA